MTRPYLVIFNSLLGSAQAVQDALDKIPEVTYWFRCFPESIFVTASLSANDLSERLSAEFGITATDNKRLLVAQIHPQDSQGWLPKAAWHLINYPNNPRLTKE